MRGFSQFILILSIFLLVSFLPVESQSKSKEILVSPTTGVGIGSVWGVFIGVSQYKTQSLNLKYADKDAKALYNFFATQFQGKIPLDQFIVLVNEEVTRGKFLGEVGEILRRAQPEDLVIISLAMHGLLDTYGTGLYFLTHDADPNNPEVHGISHVELLRKIGRSKARKIVLLLDACHTGAFAVSESVLARRSANTAEINRLLTEMGHAQDGVAVLSSSSAAEPSHEGKQFCDGHGAFTCGLLTGLQGEADTDRNGLIQLRELFDHTYRTVKKSTRGFQNPTIEGHYDNGLPLAYALGSTAGSEHSLKHSEVTLETYREMERKSEYFAKLEKAWRATKGYAETNLIAPDKRIAALKNFQQDFDQENPHRLQANELIQKIERQKFEESRPKKSMIGGGTKKNQLTGKDNRLEQEENQQKLSEAFKALEEQTAPIQEARVRPHSAPQKLLGKSGSPSQDFDIHLQMPLLMPGGKIGGPFHYFCKVISTQVMQCLLFESTDSRAILVGVEYFIAKELARAEVPWIRWNRNFHDHKYEFATGRMQVIGLQRDEAKKITDAISQTDGIIFQLWHRGQVVPDGRVTIPTSIGHSPEHRYEKTDGNPFPIVFNLSPEIDDTPAKGFNLHLQAPHLMAGGKLGGPFHHYCKGISDYALQCLLFESTDYHAKLVAIEYFLAKDLTRKNVPLIKWNRNFHDHAVEIATGRVQILSIDDENKVKEIAEAAAKTDGIIFHLWHDDQNVPDGRVTIPNSIGHLFRTE